MHSIAETLAQAKSCHLNGQWQEADCLYRQVLEAEPTNAEANFLLGVACHQLGKQSEAISFLTAAVAMKADFAQAHYYLGSLLAHADRIDEAILSYRKAIEANPAFAEAHGNLGVMLDRRGDIQSAVACYRTAIALKPDYHDAHRNLGLALSKLDQVGNAAACFQRAIALEPNDQAARLELAVAYEDLCELDEAIRQCRIALQRHEDGNTRAYLGMLLLKNQSFSEGWAHYDARRRPTSFEQLTPPQPTWDGSRLSGRTILVRSEQGFGDTIQMIRFARALKAQGAIVILECPRALVRLAATCPGIDEAIAIGETRPSFDMHIPLLNLPHIMNTTLDTIPNEVPYLWPADTSIADWKRELAACSKGAPTFKVGIAWQGNPNYPRDRLRSIPLCHFAGISRIEGMQLFSLQYGVGREQLSQGAFPVTDFADRLGDFNSTAALVKNLDLVICSDSSTAHLAGALGAKVWVLLSYSPNWRWMLGRADSPWYPTMRLFRQPVRGDWLSVLRQVERELQRLA